MGQHDRRQVLPVADGSELEGLCESLMLLLDRRQAFYRHTGVPGGGAAAAAAGVEGAELLAMLSEEDWRRGVGFADWVGKVMCMYMCVEVLACLLFLGVSSYCCCLVCYCRFLFSPFSRVGYCGYLPRKEYCCHESYNGAVSSQLNGASDADIAVTIVVRLLPEAEYYWTTVCCLSLCLPCQRYLRGWIAYIYSYIYVNFLSTFFSTLMSEMEQQSLITGAVCKNKNVLFSEH